MGKTSSQRIHCEKDLHFPLAHPSFPEPTARSAVPGVSPGRGLPIVR